MTGQAKRILTWKSGKKKGMNETKNKGPGFLSMPLQHNAMETGSAAVGQWNSRRL